MNGDAPRTLVFLAALIAMSIACGRSGLDEEIFDSPTTGGAGTTGTAGTFATGTGTAGTFVNGSAGSFATGAAGSSFTGAAGTFATGAAGTFATGAAGSTPVRLPAGVTPVPYVPVMKTVSDCSAPVGQPHEPSSVAETASLLVGRWQLCGDNPSFTLPAPRRGMEFARDRRWRAMDLVGEKLVPATGFDSEGVWYIAPEDPNDMLFLNKQILRIWLTGGRNSGVDVDFLQNPTRLRTSDGGIFVWRGE